ncbi:hypothetical protein BJX76DRAFT_361783 [Aspergillus varians]
MRDFCCFNESYKSSTPLEELTLLGCDLAPETLGKVLAAPKALQRFTFRATAVGWAPCSVGQIQAYIDVIQQQASLLRMLDLDFLWAIFWRTPNVSVNFRTFHALQDLTMVTQAIEGNLVPENHPPIESPFPASEERLRLRFSRAPNSSRLDAPYMCSPDWGSERRTGGDGMPVPDDAKLFMVQARDVAQGEPGKDKTALILGGGDHGFDLEVWFDSKQYSKVFVQKRRK